MYQEINHRNAQDDTRKDCPNPKSEIINPTTDKDEVGKNLLIRYMIKLDKAKKSKAKSIRIKNNWKKKYYKLQDKYKDLKEVFEIYKHLP